MDRKGRLEGNLPHSRAVRTSALESRKRIKRQKQLPAWALAVIDILAAGVFLCIFSYFHHVNPIRQDAPPVELPTSPIQTQISPSQTPDEGDVADKFLAAGEQPVKTENSYMSENVNVTVKTHQEGNLVYHVADIYVRDVSYLRTEMAGGTYGESWPKRAMVDEISRSVNAFVAINGDQCTAHREGVVVRNGVLYREIPYKDVCVLRYDGTLETIPQREFDVEKLKAEGAWQVWSFGPMLLQNGRPMTEFNSDVPGANPRSAVGMVEPGHYMLVTVDGRGELAGMTLAELSQLFYELGCTTAYNLDGGDTAAMAVDGAIYSKPSGERKATDIIYIAME